MKCHSCNKEIDRLLVTHKVITYKKLSKDKKRLERCYDYEKFDTPEEFCCAYCHSRLPEITNITAAIKLLNEVSKNNEK